MPLSKLLEFTQKSQSGSHSRTMSRTEMTDHFLESIEWNEGEKVGLTILGQKK